MNLVMIGRTNDQQALPITLGFKIVSWTDELNRCMERLEESRKRVFVGQFFGAVGTLASLENEAIARVFCLTDAALDTAKELLSNLEVHEENIQKNLSLLGGLIFTEALMMRLSGEYGRLEAHEMLYQLVQRSISEHLNFRSLLEQDPVISACLTKQELDQIMDAGNYIGLSGYFVDQVTK